jgi:hypothetical protein
MRHTQLQWLRDFQGINLEIWFADTERDVEKIDGEELEAYGFQDVKKDSSEKQVRRKSGELIVDIPGELAAIVGLSENDSVKWRLKSGDELILDTR